jgi:NTP pyrophosphatase (non-canonical NTP hydrolase)
MTLNDYQIWTRTTAIYPPQEALGYLALGLSSEAGEVAGKIKKYIRDGTYDQNALEAEIGDVFWYLCRLADELGVDSEDILQRNKEKLESRLARGVLGGSGDNR